MDLGFFGNIWVKQNHLEQGDTNKGHKHFFDHVSLLTEGSVEVSVEGCEPKIFTAPTFIIIRKEHNHTFKALSPRVTWYCVFALRDLDGQVIDDLYGTQHDPMSAEKTPDDYWEKSKNFDALTTHE